MFRLRRFQKADLQQVMKIVGKTLGENYDPSIYLTLFKHWPEAFNVVERHNKCIGFSLGAINEDRSARLLMLAVLPRYRRRGIGTLLLRAFFRTASGRGVRKLILEVRVTNKPALKFYQMHGYKITGILQRYYSTGEDAYSMEKSIYPTSP